MIESDRIAFAAALAAALGATPAHGASTAPDNAAMRRLASDRGCVVCHSDTAPGREPAVSACGPSRDEGRASFAQMLPNEGEVSAEEARSLVRWNPSGRR